MKTDSKYTINHLFITPKLLNIHFVKDIGMVPYYLHKLFKVNSKILTYKNNQEYPYLKQITEGLKIEFIERNEFFSKILHIEFSIIKYLIKNAKSIDILGLLHLANPNVLYCIIYKIFNKNGITFMKTDSMEDIKYHNKIINRSYNNYNFYKDKGKTAHLKNIIRIKLAKLLKKKFLKSLDLISVECRDIFEDIKDYSSIKNKLIYLPNGFDLFQLKIFSVERLSFEKKDNIILTSGRLGTYQKATEILLEAISKINDLKDWKVVLIGSIEPTFKSYIEDYFKKNPHLKEVLIFKGEVIDRKVLLTYYQRSKIFCLTSRFEGYPHVFPEAAYFGNFIVSSDLNSARDITNNGKFGKLFKINDSRELANILQDLIKNQEILKENYEKMQNYISQNYLWKNIITKLYNEIKRKRIS